MQAEKSFPFNDLHYAEEWWLMLTEFLLCREYLEIKCVIQYAMDGDVFHPTPDPYWKKCVYMNVNYCFKQ